MSHFFIAALRAIISFLMVFIAARLIGKRQLSSLTFGDFVVGIMLGAIGAKTAVLTQHPVSHYLPALISIPLLHILFTFLSSKYERFRILLEGESIVLIHNGRVLEKNLKKSRLNIDDLTSLLRLKNVFTFGDVSYALLEKNGGLSVSTEKEQNGIPKLIIKDGKLIKQELYSLGITEEWLQAHLRSRGILDYSQIMLCQIDLSGILYIDFYERETIGI